MAMTMADNAIRKACDRCHTQKLSCKRVGDEPCERCTRLKTECKSSPSLRYKKQQQQQQQQQHLQQQQSHQPPTPHPYQHQLHLHQPQHRHQPGQPPVPSAETVQIRSRSPKRRRTDSDPSLVLPEAVPIAAQAEGLAARPHVPVTPETVLDISDFNFDFGQLGFFTGGQPGEPLSHPGISNQDFHLHPGIFVEPWDQHHQQQLPHPHQQLTPSSGTYSVVTPRQLPQSALHSSPVSTRPVPLRSRSGPSEHHGVSDKKIRNRGSKYRPRQIALRQSALRAQQLDTDVVAVHWMAQLNDINTRLLDLSSALPSQQDTTRGGPPLHRPYDERFRTNGFPIDEMFQLTRRVADILDHFSSSDCGKDAAKARQALLDNSDPANSMLVLATYIRLLDMYQRVFNLVSTELEQADADAAFRFWKLPDVSVGSFAVESSPSLQMSFTIQLAEEFLGRLRSSTAALDSSSMRNGDGTQVNGANGRSMFSGVVEVSYQAVRSREENLAKQLAELRAEIEALLES